MARKHHAVLDLLALDIVSGTLTAGQDMSREAALATEFGVSRGVVREALRGLEDRGLVTIRHGRRTTVNAPDRWNVLNPEVLTAMVQAGRGATVLAEYMEMRRLLEVEAAGLAAEHATTDDLIALSNALARGRVSADRASVNSAAEQLVHEADVDFHGAIMAAAGNRVLARLTEPIRRALLAARAPVTDPQFSIEQGVPAHARILSAIASRDTDEARAAMSDHLDAVTRIIADYVQQLARDRDTNLP